MARAKKSIPKDVQKAQKRIDGMKSIDSKLDLGNGVSVEAMEAAVKKVIDGIGESNTMLAVIDQRDNVIGADIKSMNELSSRVLSGGEFKFGKNSDEYEMLGGTRSSERKKSVKKAVPKP